MATSSSDSTRTRDYGSMNPAAALQQHRNQEAGLVGMLEAVSGQLSNKAESAAAAAQQAGVSAGQATIAKGAIEAMERQRAIDLAEEMGASAIIKQAHEKRVEAMNIKDQLLPQIREAQAVNPLEDPLKWLTGKFTTPTLIKAYNMANRQEKDMTNRITVTEQGVAQKKAVDLAPTMDLITLQAKSLASAQELEALARAEQIRTEALGNQARLISQKVALGQADLSSYLQVARMTADMQMSERSARLQERRMDLDDRALSKAEREERDQVEILAQVNMHGDLFGRPRMTMARWRLLDKATQSEMATASQSPTIGQTLGDSYLTVVKNNATTALRTANPGAFEFMVRTQQSKEFADQKAALGAGPAAATFLRMSDEQQNAKVFDELQKKWNQEYTKEKINSKLGASNPNKLDFSRVTQYPELQGTYFADQMRELQKSNPGKQWQESDILAMAEARARQAMKDKKPQEIVKIADDLSFFFKQGMTSQYAYGGLHAVGLERPTGYGLSADSKYQDAKGITRALQAFNPIELQHYLMQRALAPRSTGFGGNSPLGIYN